MQENEFEKKIRLKMDELQLVPNEDVWKKVSANIYKDKRRRRFIFFLFAFTFLAGGSGVYLVSNSTSSDTVKTTKIQNSGSKPQNNPDTNKAETESKTGNVGSKTAPVVGPKAGAIEPVAKRLVGEEATASGVQRYSEPRKVKATNKKRSEAGFNELLLARPESPTKAKAESSPSQNPMPERTPPGANEAHRPSLDKPDSSAQKVLDKPFAAAKKDTAAPAITTAKSSGKVKVTSNKKWKLGFTAFTGMSNNLSGFSLFSGGAASLTAAFPATTPGNGNAPINKLTYKSDLSYGFGIYLKRSIGKIVRISAGANYHFLSATSPAGSRNVSRQTFYDANLQFSSVVTEYYNNGQTVKYKNKYHVLEVPLNVFVQLNQNQLKPISLSFGATPSYLIGSNALYANTNQNVYYVNKEQFRKILISAQMGVMFPLANTPRFDISVGPQVQYGLNNMTKPATGTEQHLLSAGLKLNFTLK